MDPQNPNNRSGQATASLVLGILTVVFMALPYVGCLLALLAVIFAASVLNGAPVSLASNARGMAIAGLVLGILGLVVGLPYTLGVSCMCAMLPSIAFYW